MSKFTEAKLEEAIISLLGEQGFHHRFGESITRAADSEVLIKEDLRTFLSRQYAADGITEYEIEAVINQLEAYSAADLYESNKAIMQLVADGFLLKREDHTQKDLYIQLIDYSGLVAFREPTPDQVGFYRHRAIVPAMFPKSVSETYINRQGINDLEGGLISR
ncbi:MAG: type I restriction endonuclease [Opitutales bacterium]